MTLIVSPTLIEISSYIDTLIASFNNSKGYRVVPLDERVVKLLLIHENIDFLNVKLFKLSLND